MPIYEYICRKCRKKFSEVLTIREHDTVKIRCPRCKRTEVEPVIEPFFAKTSKKSAG